MVGAPPALPEVARKPGSDGDNVVVTSSCDVGPVVVVEANGRRRVHGVCDPRQHREQLLLTTNTSRVAVYFADTADLLYRPTTQPQRPSSRASQSVTNFIMKLEGTCAPYHQFVIYCIRGASVQIYFAGAKFYLDATDMGRRTWSSFRDDALKGRTAENRG